MGTAELQEIGSTLEQGEKYCDLIHVELYKPSPDADKIEAWTGEIREILAKSSAAILDSLTA